MVTCQLDVQVGFETEGTAIYDAMRHVRNEVRLPRLSFSTTFVGGPYTAMHGALDGKHQQNLRAALKTIVLLWGPQMTCLVVCTKQSS